MGTLGERTSRIKEILRENTAFSYIEDDTALYPLYAQAQDGRWVSLLCGKGSAAAFSGTGSLLEAETEAETKKPVLLLGAGGMGKTTSLLRIACSQDKRYSPFSSAICYISLYGYKGGSRTFIRDRILEGLRFQPHTDSMESARRELTELFDRPRRRQGAGVILLVDGFNEAGRDSGPLLEEIRLLSSLQGVRLILTSRSDPGDPGFDKFVLCRLDQQEVRRILTGEGILPPENMEVFDLLCFPLLLSMYIRSVKNGGKQIQPESRAELEKLYFSTILEKESGKSGDDKGAGAGLEVCVLYLLPEIAALIHDKNRAVTEEELFSLTEKCYDRLSHRAMTKIWPGWIGRAKEFRLGAQDADEWYGKAVRDILWKRFGLLIRDEDGRFRLLHQILEEYLVEQSAAFHQVFDRERRRQKRWGLMAALMLALFAAFAFGAYNYSMRLQISQKHEAMIEAEKGKTAFEYIENSGQKLAAGDRREAVRLAMEAVLLENANTTQAEEMLDFSIRGEPFPASLRRAIMHSISEKAASGDAVFGGVNSEKVLSGKDKASFANISFTRSR